MTPTRFRAPPFAPVALATLLMVDPISAQEDGARVFPAQARSSSDSTLQQRPDPSPAPPELTVDLGGYASFRWETSDASDVPTSLTLRRFVVTTDSRWGDRLQVYSEVEYERLSEIEVERSAEAREGGLEFEQELEGTSGSEIALEQAWAQLRLGRGVGVRFGAVLPPVGRFNGAHDDNLWNLPRRPMADRGARVLPAPAAWTEMGLGLVGEHPIGDEGMLSWQAYLLNGVSLDFALEEKVQTRMPNRNKLVLEAAVSPRSGAFDGSNTADAVAGRVAFSPALGVELGLSGYLGDYTPSFLDVDARLSTVAADGRARLGPLVAQGEVLHTRYGDLPAVLTDFARAAVDHATETEASETAELESEAEIELSGLSDTRTGFWVDVAWPLALARGTLGFDAPVLTPVVRYERVWLDGDLEELDFAAGSVTELTRVDRAQERVSAGLAFRPVPQAVVQLVYERNRAVTGALVDPGVEEATTNGFVLGMAVGF